MSLKIRKIDGDEDDIRSTFVGSSLGEESLYAGGGSSYLSGSGSSVNRNPRTVGSGPSDPSLRTRSLTPISSSFPPASSFSSFSPASRFGSRSPARSLLWNTTSSPWDKSFPSAAAPYSGACEYPNTVRSGVTGAESRYPSAAAPYTPFEPSSGSTSAAKIERETKDRLEGSSMDKVADTSLVTGSAYGTKRNSSETTASSEKRSSQSIDGETKNRGENKNPAGSSASKTHLSSSADPLPVKSRGHRRILILLLSLCNQCLYISRANMSSAVLFMYPEDDTGQYSSYIQSSFYIGYCLFQMSGGYLATKWGGKTLLWAAVALWSVTSVMLVPLFYVVEHFFGNDDSDGSSTGLGPTEVILSLLGVCFCRMLTGMSEGMNYPAQTELISRWIPIGERSKSWCWIVSGELQGTILAMYLCPLIGHAFGWQWIFHFSALLGVIWLTAFTILITNYPKDCKFVQKEECELIEGSLAKERSSSCSYLNGGHKHHEAARNLMTVDEFLQRNSTTNTTTNSSMESVELPARLALPRFGTPAQPTTSTRTEVLLDPEFGRNSNSLQNNHSGSDTIGTFLQKLSSSDLGNRNAKRTPWKKIFQNVPFLTNTLAHFCFNWSYYLMLSQLPVFFKHRFNVNYESMAWASTSPYMIALVICLIAGPTGDILIRKITERGGGLWSRSGIIMNHSSNETMQSSTTISDSVFQSRLTASTTMVRKFYASLANIVQGVSLILLAQCESEGIAIALVCVGIGFSCFQFGGCFATYLELSPSEYGASMMAAGNTIASVPGIFSNYSVKLFNGDFEKILLTAAIIELLGLIPFLIWGQAKDQRF